MKDNKEQENELKELKKIYQKWKETNDTNIAQYKILTKKLEEDFDCESIEEAKEKMDKLKIKIEKRKKLLKERISSLIDDMKEIGIYSDD